MAKVWADMCVKRNLDLHVIRNELNANNACLDRLWSLINEVADVRCRFQIVRLWRSLFADTLPAGVSNLQKDCSWRFAARVKKILNIKIQELERKNQIGFGYSEKMRRAGAMDLLKAAVKDRKFVKSNKMSFTLSIHGSSATATI